MNNLGELIKSKRKQKKMTQGQLAGRLSVTTSTISKWENGMLLPDVYTVAQICRILDFSFDEYFEISNSEIKRELNDLKSEVSHLTETIRENNEEDKIVLRETRLGYENRISTIEKEHNLEINLIKDENDLARLRYRKCYFSLITIASLVIILIAGSLLIQLPVRYDENPILIRQDFIPMENSVSFSWEVILDEFNCQRVESKVLDVTIDDTMKRVVFVCGYDSIASRLFGSKSKESLIYTVIETVSTLDYYETDKADEKIDMVIYYFGNLDELVKTEKIDELMKQGKVYVLFSH